ncbi:MAG: hypothetical protein M1836_003909 [Candelina mexicana]|nr:MAG: hypothetical protein M1836_003909 [Candelina mexicana]
MYYPHCDGFDTGYRRHIGSGYGDMNAFGEPFPHRHHGPSGIISAGGHHSSPRVAISPFDPHGRFPPPAPHYRTSRRGHSRHNPHGGYEHNRRHGRSLESTPPLGSFDGTPKVSGNSRNFTDDGQRTWFIVEDVAYYVESMRDLPKDFHVNYHKAHNKDYSQTAWQNLFAFINRSHRKSLTQLGGDGPRVTEDVQTYCLAKELKLDNLRQLVFEKLSVPGYAPGFNDFSNAVGYILRRKEHGDLLYGWAMKYARNRPLYCQELIDHLHRLPRSSSLREELRRFLTKVYDGLSSLS